MKTKLTKLTAVLLAGILLVPTLAACSTSGENTDGTNASTTVQVEAETDPVENAIEAIRK